MSAGGVETVLSADGDGVDEGEALRRAVEWALLVARAPRVPGEGPSAKHLAEVALRRGRVLTRVSESAGIAIDRGNLDDVTGQPRGAWRARVHHAEGEAPAARAVAHYGRTQ